MTTHSFSISTVALVLAAGSVLLALKTDARAPHPGAPGVHAIAEQTVPARTVTLDAEVTAAVELVLFPDGRKLLALNGTVDAPPIRWDPKVPYAEVVGTERDSRGIDWYVHKNGSRSTVQMIWRSDLDRKIGMSITAHPIDVPATAANAAPAHFAGAYSPGG